MSPRRRHKDEERKRVDFDMEEITHFVNIISICCGALLIVSIIAFLITKKQAESNVIYALVIAFNAIAFVFGRLFTKKYCDKD